jgi:putative ABC transport system substrate-binding protein
MRRVGVIMNTDSDGPEASGLTLLQRELQQLGWNERSLRVDVRWGKNDVELDRKFAAELVALAPDVVVASGTLSVTALQRVSHTLPIVFVRVSDPVGAGVVESLARPGGNATGFMNFEYNLSGKWIELLKQIVPGVKRAAIVRDASNPAGVAQFGAIRGAAAPLGIDVSPINIRNAGEIERAVATFAHSPNGGLIVTPSAGVSEHGPLIVALAARHKLPAVYGDRFNVTGGGLISYGPEGVEQFRLAAGYVDRILRGEKPADLPVQAPTKFRLVINLKTAKALGLSMPASLLASADEVIE